ncbi:MAG: hypothetical protein R2864_14385 [Syntrophotaleaceae bacterium]
MHTTMNLAMQQAAQQAVRDNLRSHDRRQGFRGPLRTLDKEQQQLFVAEQSGAWAKAPAVGETPRSSADQSRRAEPGDAHRLFHRHHSS